MATDYRHMYEFQLQSIYALRKAIEEAAGLADGTRSAPLEAFYRRYRTDWEVASGSTVDAIRFRNDLSEAGESMLPRQESELLAKLRESLDSKHANGVRASLQGLYDVNLRYSIFAYRSVLERNKTGRIRLVVIGIAGVALTLFLGLHVHRAVAPRIQRLVGYIREFQNGKYETISDVGRDDIAVLTNALNTGLSAIALRERDHERFLAIAAHELKTPVTSIYGYASLLVSHSGQATQVDRALDIIYRQSWRLSRLIESLFLAVRARSGDLKFFPKPLNFTALLRRVLEEMQPFFPTKPQLLRIDENISVLGDESLLEHALWALLTCATSLSDKNEALQLALTKCDGRAELDIDIQKTDIPMPDLEELFIPLRAMEYETGTGMRSAVGLYLCREIMRVHNGQLYVHRLPDLHPEFVVAIPI